MYEEKYEYSSFLYNKQIQSTLNNSYRYFCIFYTFLKLLVFHERLKSVSQLFTFFIYSTIIFMLEHSNVRCIIPSMVKCSSFGVEFCRMPIRASVRTNSWPFITLALVQCNKRYEYENKFGVGSAEPTSIRSFGITLYQRT